MAPRPCIPGIARHSSVPEQQLCAERLNLRAERLGALPLINDFIERLNVAQSHGSEVFFVEITCPEAVIEERIELPSRKEHQKLSSLATYRELRAQGAFDYPALPSNGLILDSSEHDPASAANAIVTRFTL